MLAAYAVSEGSSRGRIYPEQQPDFRNPFQRDRDRVVHCAAFRRLEYKTQVFLNHEGDMFRTRLTHSIEVAQIARTIARELQLNEDLVEAIALAHDLGHTPFGHAGQDALNACMRDYGGFEHNLQSLRIVDKLEKKYANFSGLNLTFEVREGILKHCSRRNAQQLGEVGRRFLEKTQPTLEAQLADIADEIAYHNHDVDDGLRSGLIEVEQLLSCQLFSRHYQVVIEKWPNLSLKRVRYEVHRRMLSALVNDLIEHSRETIKAYDPSSLEMVRKADAPLIGLSAKMRSDNLELKRFLHRYLYQRKAVQKMASLGSGIVKNLFAAYMNKPALVKNLITDEKNDLWFFARKVSDYIAGMTDRFAIAEYEKLFGEIDYKK